MSTEPVAYVDAEAAVHDALDTAASNGDFDFDGEVSWLSVTTCVLELLVERGLVLSPPASLTVIEGGAR